MKNRSRTFSKLPVVQLAGVFLWGVSGNAAALTVTPTTVDLAAALNPSGLTINSAVVKSGGDNQFGTYSGFSQAPVSIANGIVLSTGNVNESSAEFHSTDDLPSSDLNRPGTPEFNAYGKSKIENFSDSNDVASLAVNFSLAAPSRVAFDFVFGSVEYPTYTSKYTDAFLTFLDGTSNQISFDSQGNPIQVGKSFASLLNTEDNNTAFHNPHGLLPSLTTTTTVLAAGEHTLLFEVGDVNDHILDSAAFIANLRTTNEGGCTGNCTDPTTGPTPGGPGPIPGTPAPVPVPAAAWLLGSGLIGLLGGARRRKLQS